jgi:hypothetical protein
VVPEFFGATSYIYLKKKAKSKNQKKKKKKTKNKRKMKIELGGCLFNLGVIRPPPRAKP